MAQIKNMVLDWSVIGSIVATGDSIIQAEFFKGFAEGLKEYDTDYMAQMQFAIARDQKSHKPGEYEKQILTAEHQKALSNALIMLWPEGI